MHQQQCSTKKKKIHSKTGVEFAHVQEINLTLGTRCYNLRPRDVFISVFARQPYTRY